MLTCVQGGCAPEARAEDFEKLSWVESWRKTVDFRLLTEARPVALWQVPHMLGGAADGKTSIERLCLSPYVEKPFNSKVIKSFVPELRSRKRIPVFYIYMSMNIICTFHISISWVCYKVKSFQTEKLLDYPFSRLFFYLKYLIQNQQKNLLFCLKCLFFPSLKILFLIRPLSTNKKEEIKFAHCMCSLFPFICKYSILHLNIVVSMQVFINVTIYIYIYIHTYTHKQYCPWISRL